MSQRAWYKRYPTDFVHGVVGLGPAAIGAYAIVLDLIYDHAGPIIYDTRWLGGILGCSPRMASSLIDRLVCKGKLSVENGRITNVRAEKELENASTNTRLLSEAGARGGRKRAENALDTRKNNDLSEARLKHLEKRREEKKEEKDISQPYGCSSETSSDPDPEDEPSPRRKRVSYPPDFQAFWQAYPTDKLMSKAKALQAWRRLDSDARNEAMASLPAFRAYCASQTDYRPVHAIRYITEQRFEGFNQLAEQVAGTVFVAKGTPQWNAWQRVKKTPCVLSREDHCDGWWFDSIWPNGPEA